MNITNSADITDNTLVAWILSQWKENVKAFRKCDEELKRIKILISLAKILRQFINAVRTKRAGVQDQYKTQAHSMIQWLEKELYQIPWSEGADITLKAIQYGRKHTGNIAIEGVALKRAVSASDRRNLARLTAKAAKRLDDSVERIITEEHQSDSDYRNIGLLADSAELD